MNLKNKILDERNIFNSIFCMESYVFDKGLLNTDEPINLTDENGDTLKTIATNDLELYYALADKHNVEFIENVIKVCQQKLKWIFTDKENLFDTTVYFKLKKYDTKERKLKFRPIHTARLIDMICMVSILNCLMFDDDLDSGERNLSDLSKLLPHNFYGNIPSTDVQFLFHKWKIKYREYTDEIIKHCRLYKYNHNYLTEVSLDIQNFFPSISPKMLYNYIVEKLSKTYDKDINTLSMAVAKLLFFNLKKNNIEPWKEYYYEGVNLTDTEVYMVCGIPQGLPQSYFFGNLCMIEINHLLMKDEYFNGDAYFYVDDSVIYIQTELNEQSFKDKISNLNEELKEWCHKKENTITTIENYIGNDCLTFHKQLNYCIRFHEEGKSVFTHIDDVDNLYGPIANITRETSLHSKLAYNLDEIDDRVSLKKVIALDKVISREIKELMQKQKDNNVNSEKSEYISSKLKMLRRFKKFFLYRNRLLNIREKGGPNEEMLREFRNRFLEKSSDAESFFEQLEEDIFQSEYRLLIQKLTKKEAEDLKVEIINFEQKLLKEAEIYTVEKLPFLFYAKDVDAAFKMKSMSIDIYNSLVKWAKENFCGMKSLNPDIQMGNFLDFLSHSESNNSGQRIFIMKKNGFEEKIFTLFVMKSSAEYQRRILNVFFSEVMGITPSDDLVFSKMNAIRFNYTELRLLAYLRNRNFSLERFEGFVTNIREKDVSNQIGIDMGLLEVLNIFILNVKDPEWVDMLILTHRLTKGLWYNGSKFLNSYTLHNEEHAITLIRKSLELTNRIDYFELKNIDFYILFLACYLHDISMVIHPDLGRLSSENGQNIILISNLMLKMTKELKNFWEIDINNKKGCKYKDAGKFLITVFTEVYEYFENLVRSNHAKDSAKFILDRSNSLLSYLEPTLLSYVAKVSDSHGYDVIDVYGLKSRANEDTISLKYLMIIIRLADLLDVANDRVNYYLLKENLKNLSFTSRFHWISHLVTDKIELDTNYITDENVKLNDKPITEEINLNLFLKVKQLTITTQNKKCEGCKFEQIENKDSINIKIMESGSFPNKCPENKCIVLCYWMMQKHDWLIKELVALNNYLFSVNNSLFKTKINFKIHYRDEMKLDADMFDSIKKYLKI